MDLTGTKVAALTDDAASWPKPEHLILDGFVYDRILQVAADKPECATELPNEAQRLEWLRLMPRDAPIRFQPYTQVLHATGYEADAKNVLISMEKELHPGIGGWFFYLTIGFGHEPWRALYCAAAVALLGVVLFGLGYWRRIVVPSDKDALLHFQEWHKPPRNYRRFNLVVFAIDALVPVIDLRQKNFWMPADSSGWFAATLRFYLLFEIVVGWILTTLFLAAITGLIRQP